MATDDVKLRTAYAALLERRAAAVSSPDVPIETVQALAEGRYTGSDRVELLETILSDAGTAAEFQFFMDLARERPAAPDRRGWLAAAAIFTLSLGVAVFWQATRPPPPEPLRGDAAEILIAPAAGATAQTGASFTWRSVAGAEDYRFELIAEDGTAVHEAATTDTTLT
jgi:hypothetical protein